MAEGEHLVKIIVLIAIALLALSVISGALKSIAGDLGSPLALLIILVLGYYFFLRRA